VSKQLPAIERIGTILVGVDGSRESIRAAEFAATLADQLGADVVAAHAVGLLDVWPEHPEVHAEHNSHQRVTALMEGQWTEPLRQGGGRSPRLVLRDGAPATVLLAIADEVGADLIVVGSRGAGQADLYALGDTSAKLTHLSTRPVIVVPAVRHDLHVSGGVFAGVTESTLLSTGCPVDIAPAQVRDLERVRAFYQHLSDASTYYRFFTMRRALPDQELHDMVGQDGPHHVTLLASVAGELIGIGEYVVGESRDEAEVAFAVADDHHREGVATLLLERLAVVARRCGIKHFTATTLPGNHDMQLVFRTVGLTQQSHFDGGVVDVTLDLASLDHLEIEAAARHQHALAILRSAVCPSTELAR
jgi:nucleotide-binding universal stress UspA family protein/GNAT superfamily N-acetyltransferase